MPSFPQGLLDQGADIGSDFWRKNSATCVVVRMNEQLHHPLEQLGTGEVLRSVDWHWLMLTPFPEPVVWFSLAAGVFILLIAWLQPSTHQRTLQLTGAGIITVSLLFWLLLVVVALCLLRYVRQPGWARRR